MSPKLLTASEVASALGLTTARVYSLSREGMFPFLVKIGDRQYRYNSDGLHEYVANGGNIESMARCDQINEVKLPIDS